jgi:RNA-directed DNA polymerase
MPNSDSTLNPNGGVADWRMDMQPALDLNLMMRIIDSANVLRAWNRVKSNQGASGIDGMSVEEFPDYAREHWSKIRQSLINGTYQPSPVRRVVIPKPHTT